MLSAELAGDASDDQVTYARWLEQKIAETSSTKCWLTTLLIVLVAVPFIEKERMHRELSASVGAAKEIAEETSRLRKEVDRLTTEDSFLVMRKHQTPSATTVLDDITRVLPDDTWLTRFEMQQTTVQIFGNSPRASALIGLIEGAPLFQPWRIPSQLCRRR